MTNVFLLDSASFQPASASFSDENDASQFFSVPWVTALAVPPRTIVGVVSNFGTITLSQGDGLILNIGNSSTPSATLAGGGKVVLKDPAAVIQEGVPGAKFTNRNNTISGYGTIGEGSLVFNNLGSVIANGPSPLTLKLSASTTSVNYATMEAVSGGELDIAQGAFQNLSTLFMADGGTVSVESGATFSNPGTVTAKNGGMVIFAAGADSDVSGGALVEGQWVAGSPGATTTSTLSFADAFTTLSTYMFLYAGSKVMDGGEALESRLTDISQGALLIVGRNYVTTNALTVAGELDLYGPASPTFSSGKLTVTGTLGGSGTFASDLDSTYRIVVDGGLTFTGVDSVAGSLQGYGVANFKNGSVAFAAGTSLTTTPLTFANETATFSGVVAAHAQITAAATAFGGSGALEIQTGALFQSGVSASVAHLTIDAKAKLNLSESLSYGGAFRLSQGGALQIAAADTFTLFGASTLAGVVTGGGLLRISGGATTIANGASIATAGWKLTDGVVNVAALVSYAGAFSAYSQAAVNLTFGSLALNGTAYLNGVKVTSGDGRYLFLNGAATINRLEIDNSAGVYVNGVAEQSLGRVTLGDQIASHQAALVIGANGTWRIGDNSGIAVGADANSRIVNNGVFEKAGGGGVSAIAPVVLNNGNIVVDAGAGVLDFQASVFGTGEATISAHSSLEFDAAVGAGQTVDFSSGQGQLNLHAPSGFIGEIAGFDSTDAISLLRNWTAGAYVENASGAGGSLTLTDGGLTATLTFVGAYQDGHFHTAFANGATTLTYA